MSNRIRFTQVVLLILALLAAIYFVGRIINALPSNIIQGSSRRVVQPFPPGLTSAEEVLVKEAVSNVDSYLQTLPKACLNDRTFDTSLREYVMVKIFQATIQPDEFPDYYLERLQERCKVSWTDIEKIIDQHLESVKELIRKLDRDSFLKWFMEQFDWFVP